MLTLTDYAAYGGILLACILALAFIYVFIIEM